MVIKHLGNYHDITRIISEANLLIPRGFVYDNNLSLRGSKVDLTMFFNDISITCVYSTVFHINLTSKSSYRSFLWPAMLLNVYILSPLSPLQLKICNEVSAIYKLFSIIDIFNQKVSFLFQGILYLVMVMGFNVITKKVQLRRSNWYAYGRSVHWVVYWPLLRISYVLIFISLVSGLYCLLLPLIKKGWIPVLVYVAGILLWEEFSLVQCSLFLFKYKLVN